MKSTRCPVILGTQRCDLDAPHAGDHVFRLPLGDPVAAYAARIDAVPELRPVAEQALELLAALAAYADTQTQAQTEIRGPVTAGQRTIPRSHS